MLDGSQRHRTGGGSCSLDEDPLALLGIGEIELMLGQRPVHDHRRRFDVAQSGRQGSQVVDRHDRVLGVRALRRDANDTELETRLLAPVAAVGTRPARDAIGDDDLIADRDPDVSAGTERGDLPSVFGAQHVRERVTGERNLPSPIGDVEEAVHRHGVDPHECLGRPGRWNGDVGELQNLRPTVLVNDDRPHQFVPHPSATEITVLLLFGRRRCSPGCQGRRSWRGRHRRPAGTARGRRPLRTACRSR